MIVDSSISLAGFRRFDQLGPAAPKRAEEYWPKRHEHAATFNAESSMASSALSDFATLAAGWDGYDAEPISHDAIANARAALPLFISQLPFPEIVPEQSGTITLEWSTAKGGASLEIGSARFAFLLRPKVGNTIAIDGPVTTWPIVDLRALIAVYLYPRLNPVSLAISDITF